MRHEPPGLRTFVRSRTDLLIEIVDVRREVVVERLQFGPPMAAVGAKG
jgi:hypothetical protein